jgi:methylglyoxal synthase
MTRFDDDERERRWRVALIADPAKQQALARLVRRYREQFASWDLLAPAATAAALPEAPDLKLLRVLPERGGIEAITTAVAAGEVDALVLLRDPLAIPAPGVDHATLPRVADINNVPVATNLAAAECLVRALAPEGGLAARR